MNCEQALIEFFEKNLGKLKDKKDYWRIPQIEGFKHSNETSYEANVRLKLYFNQQWHNTSGEQKKHLAKVIISDWGGVKKNKDSTLENFIIELSKDTPATPLKGIASYSKVFSIVYLEKYAIYDARVAVSLNAIQYIAGVNEGLAFNYIPGRNNITGHVGKKIGFVYAEPFKVKSLVNSGWRGVKKDNTYETYLTMLHNCMKSFQHYHLYDLEMALFSNAEDLCKKALQKANIVL